MTTVVALVILVPAVAAVAGLLLVRRGQQLAQVLAVGASLVALVAALVELFSIDTGPPLREITGAPVGQQVIEALPALDLGVLEVPLHLQVSGSVALVAAIVTLVTFTVQVFAAWYLRDDDRYDVFAATVSLFAAGMLLVVQSADLVLTIVGWEVMGWCSYLLIGHWSRKASARRAALKAFLVTRFADIGFVLGVVILAAGAGSTAYGKVIAYWSPLAGCADGPCLVGDPQLRTAAIVLLIIGILGKSAQFPFQDWLADAMEGPTPASALIHAATMVAAGTFVLAQLMPILAASEAARWVLAITVIVTMLGAGVLAFGQSDLKRLLAWSTVSQIAIMLSPLAAAPANQAAAAGTLHLYAHAIFKALLFLTVGWLSVLGGGTSARALRGTGNRHALARLSWLFGLLALAGVPVTVGGISKEHIIAVVGSASASGAVRPFLVYAALLVAVVLTAAYATRAYLVVTAPVDGEAAAGTAQEPVPAPGAGTADAAEPDAAAEPGDAEPEETAGASTGAPHPGTVSDHAGLDGSTVAVGVPVVLSLLVGLTVVGGLVTLTGVLPLEAGISTEGVLLSLVLIFIGAFAALWGAGADRDPAVTWLGPAMAAFDGGFGADRVYVAVVARPVLALARLVAFIDTEVIDAYVRGGAAAARIAGVLGRRVHARERATTGLVWVALGAFGITTLGVLLWS